MSTSQIYTPTHKRISEWGNVTPQFEVSEGIRPARAFLPAPYLPVVRYNEYYRDYFVISAGTPVALDSHGFLIPAGLALQFQNVSKSTGVNLATTSGLTLYSATDVAAGVKNALGQTVVAGEPVIAAMLGISNAGGEDWTSEDTRLDKDVNVVLALTPAIGFATYDYWQTAFTWAPTATVAGVAAEARALFESELAPTRYRYHNYALQGVVGITTRAFVQVPVVKVATNFLTSDTPVFGGMARGAEIASGTKYEGNLFYPGISVGYDTYSRYIPVLNAAVATDPSTSAATWLDISNTTSMTDEEAETAFMKYHAELSKICGRCLAFEPLSAFPKDKLAHVRTAYNLTGFSGTDKMPGSATGGYPDTITFAAQAADTDYSDIAGIAYINLVFDAH